MEREEVFAVQTNLLLKAADLIHAQLEQIKPSPDDLSVSSAEAVKLVYRVRSLGVFENTLRYLASEIISTDANKYIFLLAHTRTLMNIQGNFLHLMINCKDEEKLVMTCIAQQLLTTKLVGVEAQYKELLSMYEKQNLFSNYKVLFPSELKDFSRKWIKNHDLTFATAESLLTEENIKKYSVDTVKIFGVKKSYMLYSFFSELLHGNPYYSREPFNERFWVVSTSLITSVYFIELIDRHILNKGQTKNFREFLKEVEKNKKEFSFQWKIPKNKN